MSNINQLNRRLTNIQDCHDETRRIEKLRKKELKLLKNQIVKDYKMWNKIGHRGPYSFTELFNYTYGDSIKQMSKSKNSLLDKVKPCNWTGGTIGFPF